MPELLIAYAVTASVFEDFRNTMSVQSKFSPLLPPGWTQRSTVITNTPLPVDMADFAQCIDPAIGDGHTVWFSRIRNLSMRFATEESKADWLVMLDVDSVWLGFTQLPETGYGKASIFFTQQNEPVDNLPFSDASRWWTASWWFMSRPIFSDPKLRQDEQFIGHGYNDWDFMEHVLTPRGVIASPTDAKAIHLWHRDRYSPSIHAQNGARYYQKHADIFKSLGIRHIETSEKVKK